MLRTLELHCSECHNLFTAQDKLYYRDDFLKKELAQIELVCPVCYEQWLEFWQIKTAVFYEKDCFLYVDIRLENGSEYKNLDASALDDVIVTSLDMPYAAQKNLFELYSAWLAEKRKNVIKECIFEESFMRTTFTCITYGGEEFKNIAFRFNRLGVLEVETPVDEKILEQVVEAWRIYEMTGNTHFKNQN